MSSARLLMALLQPRGQPREMQAVCQRRSQAAGISATFAHASALLQAGTRVRAQGGGESISTSVLDATAVVMGASDSSTTTAPADSIQLLLRFQAPSAVDATAIPEDLIARYRTSGSACFASLRMPFAAILWDAPQQLLVLARDQLGVEPLYYTQASSTGADGDPAPGGGDLALVAVANSLTVLARLMPSQAQVDESAMADLLLGTFLGPAATAYQGIQAVVPGETVEIDRQGRATRRRYWQLPPPAPAGRLLSARDQARVVDELGQRIRQAVVHALGTEGSPQRGLGQAHREPVPRLGCFLSGGLDSSVVAGLAARELALRHARPLTTLSLRFPGRPEADEGSYLEAFTRRFAVDHHERAFTGSDPLGDLAGLSRACGQPLLMGNHIYSSLLAGMARAAGCTAVLTGHDGDTVFGFRTLHGADLLRRGYPGRALSWYLQLSRYHCLPRRAVMQEHLLKPLLRHARAAWGAPPAAARGPTLAVATLLERTGAWERAHAQWQALPAEALCAGEEHQRELASASLTQATTFMAHLGQHHDLEIRHPLLQVDLVEYCAALPSAAMTGSGWGRAAVRLAMQELLPRRLAWRRRKADLSRPLYQALATSGMATAVGLVGPAAPPRLWDYASRAAVEALLVRLGQAPDRELTDASTSGIWPLLWMAQWLRTLPAWTPGAPENPRPSPILSS